jgi:hypothetical protein
MLRMFYMIGHPDEIKATRISLGRQTNTEKGKQLAF